MSLREFREAEEEEGYRYELAEGVLEVTEVSGPDHRRVVRNLFRAIARFDAAHPGVIETYGGGSEFRLWIPAQASGRNPDLGVVLEGALPDDQGRTQPALVGEVVSKSSRVRDYETKRREYFLYGVAEYWIIDPFIRRITVLTRGTGDWNEQTARDEQIIPSRLLPGLDSRVADL